MQDDVSHLASDVVNELYHDFRQLPESAVQHAIADALKAAARVEGTPTSVLLCQRDYSVCPEGWADLGDGNSCVAPKRYAGSTVFFLIALISAPVLGPCSTVVTFGGNQTFKEKLDVAARCQFDFPCVDRFPADYTQPCPVNWTLVFGDCVAPTTYLGPCVGRKRFADFSAAEKASWGASCRVSWPMQRRFTLPVRDGSESCIPDYSFTCPLSWVQHEKECRAPLVYQGPCSLSLHGETFSPTEKQAWASVCGVKWPCMMQA